MSVRKASPDVIKLSDFFMRRNLEREIYERREIFPAINSKLSHSGSSLDDVFTTHNCVKRIKVTKHHVLSCNIAQGSGNDKNNH